MMRPVVILGAGGHAAVVVEALRLLAYPVKGLTDPSVSLHGTTVLGVPVLGDDEAVLSFDPGSVWLACGLGSVRADRRRRALFEHFSQRGYRFASIVHPGAVVSSAASCGEGVQVMAGAVVQAGTVLGVNALVNTGAVVDHDCHIGDHVHVASGAVLAGGVEVGADTHIGAGATVLQGVRLGAGCTVGAGAVVLQDVPEGATVVGVPARDIANRSVP